MKLTSNWCTLWIMASLLVKWIKVKPRRKLAIFQCGSLIYIPLDMLEDFVTNWWTGIWRSFHICAKNIWITWPVIFTRPWEGQGKEIYMMSKPKGHDPLTQTCLSYKEKVHALNVVLVYTSIHVQSELEFISWKSSLRWFNHVQKQISHSPEAFK